ncbi:unnamed protein product [Prunus armeniaca]
MVFKPTTGVPLSCLWNSLVSYDNAPRVSRTLELCGARICVLGLTTRPPNFAWMCVLGLTTCPLSSAWMCILRLTTRPLSFARMCVLGLTICPPSSARL